MDIWSKLTAVREEWAGEDWMIESGGLSPRTYIHNHRHRQQCGDNQTDGGWGGHWREVGKGGEMGTSVIVSTIKIKL